MLPEQEACLHLNRLRTLARAWYNSTMKTANTDTALDRLLAPLPVAFVAIEKVLFAALYSLIASALVFPLAYLILGNAFQMRTDAIGLLVGLMILSAFAGASLGLTLGTAVKPEQIGLLNALQTAALFWL